MALKKHKKPNEGEQENHSNRRHNERTVNDLIIDLKQAESAVERRWAARDLAEYPDAVQDLLDALVSEQDMTVFGAILDTLQNTKSNEVVNGLLPLLRSEDAGKRNAVIEILQSMPEMVALHIIELLNDTDSDVRIFAIDILQELAHPDTPKWLLSVLKDETHINVIATAVDRLAEVGEPEMIDALLDLKLRYPDEGYLHFAIDTAVARIKGE
ncbi:MAG: HEAT repeat domain-containing protein [Gammaproteobacteria bacterium]|nr:HEAT repeat domain-containing protein [Gammaproteobacteria bacterium]